DRKPDASSRRTCARRGLCPRPRTVQRGATGGPLAGRGGHQWVEPPGGGLSRTGGFLPAARTRAHRGRCQGVMTAAGRALVPLAAAALLAAAAAWTAHGPAPR